jgi:ribonuclease Z
MSLLRVTMLGTGAATPTAGRGLSATAVRLDGRLLLVDCGEGTQRQMARFGSGFDVEAIAFTHFHADHFLGVIGFLRTLSMHGRTTPLPLYGPRSARQVLERAVYVGVDTLGFEVPIHELEPGDGFEFAGARVEAFATVHRTRSIGFAIIEPGRPGRFHPERAAALGVPPGPMFGRLQRGEAVELHGRVVTPAEVMDEARSGRRLVLSGDTRPCEGTRAAARDADLLIHEATFGDAEQRRALETMHTTAREAAELARDVGARRLLLTHLSARYDESPEVLLEQARAAFPGVEIARDGMTTEVAYA